MGSGDAPVLGDGPMVPSEAHGPGYPGDSFGLVTGGLLRILHKRWGMALAAAAAAFGLAILWHCLQPRTYQATARLQILQSLLTPGSPSQTPAAQTGSASGDPLSTPARVARSSRVAARAAAAIRSLHRQSASAGQIARALSVAVEEPDVLAISAVSSHPDRAALLANAVMDAYLEENRDVAQAGISSVRRFLEQQVPGALCEVQKAEGELKTLRARHKISDTETLWELKARVAQDSAAEADRARADADAAVSELLSLKRRLAALPPVRRVKRVVTDPMAEGFRAEVARYEVALAKARMLYDDAHPRVAALRRDLARLRQLQEQRCGRGGRLLTLTEALEPDPAYEALRQRVGDQQSRVNALKARADALAATVARRGAQLPSLPAAHAEVARLQHVRDGAEKSYLDLLERLQSAKMDEMRLLGASRVIDRARPPERPVRPRLVVTLLMATIAALVSGVGAAVVSERLDGTIGEPDEVVWLTGESPLGVLRGTDASGPRGLAAVHGWRDLTSEALRMVHARLAAQSTDKGTLTVLVTDADADEGAGSVATQLAVVLAQMSIRTVLVDLHLRPSRSCGALQGVPPPGTADVLMGSATVQDALRQTELDALRVLAGESRSLGPGASAHPRGLASLVAQAGVDAEVVVLDAPPVLLVADALLLVPHADATLLVVEQGRTRATALAEAWGMLNEAGARCPGVIWIAKQGLTRHGAISLESARRKHRVGIGADPAGLDPSETTAADATKSRMPDRLVERICRSLGRDCS